MKKIILITISITLLACRTRKDGECPATFLNKSDDRLIFVNNSKETLFPAFSYDYPKDSNFLDLSVPSYSVIDANPAEFIHPNTFIRYTSRSCWEGKFGNSIFPSDTLRIMLFNIDSLKSYNYNRKEIIKNKRYKNYLYTLQNLKDINWRVVYP
jgi:hypothetical protein